MLVVVADSNVVRAASADPTVSPAGARGGTATAPPPLWPPPPPPDEPQRPVEPGTITQGWDNSSPVSQIRDQRDVTLLNSTNETTYETAYGYFVLNKSAPYFVSVLSPDGTGSRIADSAFLVSFHGMLLQPAKGVIDNATSGELSFHYGLYLNATFQGTMTVDYRFQQDKNKITVSFAPLSRLLSGQFQIVWLTFTTWDAVDTTAYSGISTQRFEAVTQGFGLLQFGAMGTLYGTGGYTRDGIPGAAIRPGMSESDGLTLRMDVSDAVSDYETTYVGSSLRFAGHSGNVVATTFAVGHLTIDPQLIVDGSIGQDATAATIQRKTFYDGHRYWLFWKDVGPNIRDAIKYKSSPNGKNWNPPSLLVEVAGSLSQGFVVTNSGNTVMVLWVDSSTNSLIKMVSGLIAEDGIVWDTVTTYDGSLQINAPLSAALTYEGHMLGVAWTTTTNIAYFSRFLCSQGTGVSSCAVQTLLGVQSDVVGIYPIVIPLVFGDFLAVFSASASDSDTKFRGWLYSVNGGCTSPQYITVVGVPLTSDCVNHGLFTAAPVVIGTNLASTFFLDTFNGQIYDYDMDSSCNLTPDSAYSSG